MVLRACKPLVWLHVIRLPPPWTVGDLPRHFVGWLEQPRDLGRLAVTPEGKRRHDRGISSHSDLPKCGTPLIASAELQSTDMLKCPKHGDIGTLSELLDQTLQRQMGNALKEAFKKGDDDAS